MRLLIAEDTKDLNRVITVMLEHAGYDVDSVFDGEAALELLDTNGYDAVILDIMMPKVDGITVLLTLRGRNNTVPVLLLTAKTEVDDRVTGLNAGADDYLTKPFAMKELLARVKAMTRRRAQYSSSVLSFSNISLNAATLELSAVNSVRLSMKECELLRLFMQYPEKPLDTAFILEHVWPHEPEADGDTVYLYVRYLQRKLTGVAADAEISGECGKTFRLHTCPK